MNIKLIIAKNISVLRKHKKMTQLELSEKINYSDKAVSRWESGDVTPDIETLYRLSEIFEVPLDTMLKEEIDTKKTDEQARKKKINKLIITLLVITFIWTAATIIYIYSMMDVQKKDYWEIFVYAFPATFFVASVLNAIWGDKKYTYIFTSILIWSTLASFYIGFLSSNIWPLFILGAPLQVVIILWSKIRS